MSLAEPAARAAQLAKQAEYVRVLAAPTGDALAAAATLVLAFRREGIDSHVSFADDLEPTPIDRLAGESCVFLVDGWHRGDPELKELSGRCVVLSHDDGREPDGAIVLDADRGGHDGGAEATASSFAFLVAHALDKRNADLAFFALAGALAERHRLDAGLHASLAAEAEEGGHVERRKDLGYAGPLAAALAGADPWLRGVSGRARGALKLCHELKLDPEASAESLEDAERVRLASALALHLLEQGAPPSGVDALVPTDAVAKSGPFAGRSALRLSRALASAAATGRAPDALISLLAAKEPEGAALDPLPALIRAEREPEKPAEAPRGAGPAVAHALAGYLAAGRPALAWEPLDGRCRILAASPREGRADVGSAFRKAAASRAVVPLAERDAFLAAVREALGGGA